MAEQQKPFAPHGGHRARLRARFKAEGLSGFADHNALELLLFYSIPQRDTNELAHKLIAEFGSLSGVFDASLDALMHVDGIGETTAVLIKMMPELFAKYEQDKVKKNALILNSAQAAGEYLASLFVGKTKENLIAVCMNHKCKVTNTVTITEGTGDSTELNLRKIAEAAINSNASSVILAHNHPAGVAVPSAADVELTRHMILCLKNFDITVQDHFIIAGKDWFSMAASKRFSAMFE